MSEDPKRWYCVYRSDTFVEKGVRSPRAFGGRNMRCYHDLEVVLHVARKWLPATPDAKAFVYEALPLEGDPPLEEYTGPHGSTDVAEEPPVTKTTRRWKWTKPGRRTRLVLVATLVQPEHRVVELTEKLIGRGLFTRLVEQFTAQNRKRSALDPSA